MMEHRNLPVQELQHEIVDALQAAPRGRIDGVARKFFQLGLNPADDAVKPALDDRMRRAEQHRRHELVVEQDILVADLENARDAERHVTGLAGLAQFETPAADRRYRFLPRCEARRWNR